MIRQPPHDKELINECMNEWQTLQMNNWLTEFQRTKLKRANEQTSARTREQTNERTNERTSERTIEQTSTRSTPVAVIDLKLQFGVNFSGQRLQAYKTSVNTYWTVHDIFGSFTLFLSFSRFHSHAVRWKM